LVFPVRRGGGGGGEGGQEVRNRERCVITEICTKRVFSIYYRNFYLLHESAHRDYFLFITELSVYYRNLHKETNFYLISNLFFNTEISIYYKSVL